MNETPRSEPGAPSPALAAALVLALACPLLDVVLAGRKELWWGGTVPALPSAGIWLTSGAFAALLLLAFGLLRLLTRPLEGRLGLETGPLAIGTACLLAVPALLFVTGFAETIGTSDRGWPRAALLLGLGLAAGPTGYWAALGLRTRERSRQLVAAFLVASPFLLLVLFASLVVEDALRLPLRSMGFGLLALVTLAIAAGLVGWLRASAVRRAFTRASAVLAALALVGAAAAALRVTPRPDPPATPRRGAEVPRVLLVTVDTLRPDALGCYGGTWPTPHIDALAGDGVLFENATSNAPWTLPSVASLLTGLTVDVHDVVHVADSDFDRLQPLAQRLGRAGYRTASVGYNAFLAGSYGHMKGVQHGVEENLSAPRRPHLFTEAYRAWTRLQPVRSFFLPSTADLTDLAVEWIEGHAESDWFLWVHYYDPHGPYEPPAPYRPTGPRSDLIGNIFEPGAHGFRALQYAPEDLQRVRDLYQGEVRWVDDSIGRIVETLEELGQYEDTLIVFTSDHGDELLEHDDFGHGHTLYQELLHVPLALKLPGPPRAARVSERVALDSVLPTVLDVLGLTWDPERLTGASLVPLWTDPAAERAPRALYATGLHNTSDGGLRSVIFGDHKLVQSLRSGREQVFDLAADPGELRDLSTERPELLERGRALLEAGAARASELRGVHGLRTGPTEEMDPETVRLLRSMGYF